MKLLKLLFRVAASVVIFVAILELCARLDDFFTYQAPLVGSYSNANLFQRDQLGRRGIPGARYKKWQMNSLGYRGPELRSGTVRIVCIGSSETFGLYEDAGQEYPRQLERDLNQWAGKPTFEVVNVAYPAQSVAGAVLRVPEVVETLRPRLAVIYASPALYAWLPAVNGVSDDPPPARFEWRLAERIRTAGKSLLPGFIQDQVREFQNRERERYIRRKIVGQQLMDSLPEENVNLFHSDLVRLVDALRQRGVEPVLVTHATLSEKPVSRNDQQMLTEWRRFFPLLTEEGYLDMARRMNATVRAVATEQHVVLVDAATEIAPGSQNFGDFLHFTTAGAEVMAARVAEGLEPLLQAEVSGVAEQTHRTQKNGNQRDGN